MKSYRVSLCCNDDRGNFEGRVSEVQVGDELHLVHVDGLPPRLRIAKTEIKVSRHSYAARDHSTWVGNVMWDAVTMDADAAALLVATLISDGWVVEEYAEDSPFAQLWTERKSAR